ncbi:MAG TPA: polyprenyl synthetase family protein [Candidatus Polarisedimenticolia bacterium]|nr:polyprenyl synthetase family protein [Candidatus Polarisedimenticolia bacterium]
MAATDSRAEESLHVWMSALRAEVDAMLPALLPARHETAADVHDAMAYGLLSPGKRIRPILCLGVAQMYRVEIRRILPAACALEMVHTASLLLDDLPSMDDAPQRRGRASCHVVFGESTAILAAVGLLSHAFDVLARGSEGDRTRDRVRCLVAGRLAAAIGPDGLIGGQAADLETTRRARGGAGPVDLTTLEFVHSHKTGSLFIASAAIGAELAGATLHELEALEGYARNLGLAFQITDDLIDAVGDARKAGKPVRSDQDKTTFVTLCGVEGARSLAADLVRAAESELAPFGRRAARLAELARFVSARDR